MIIPATTNYAPRLSVITVCRNCIPEIERTIRSVLGQTEQAFEWIVVDGGSDDGTVQILSKIAFKKIDCFISEPDRGPYEAMNKGISRATGEYILFLNGGDAFAAEDVIAASFPFLHDEDVIYGSLRIVTPSRTCFYHPLESVSPILFYSTTLPHPSTFVRRIRLQQANGFDLSYRIIADRVLFYMLAKNGATFRKISTIVGEFYVGGLSTSAITTGQHQTEIRRFQKTHFPVRYTLDGARKATLNLKIFLIKVASFCNNRKMNK